MTQHHAQGRGEGAHLKWQLRLPQIVHAFSHGLRQDGTQHASQCDHPQTPLPFNAQHEGGHDGTRQHSAHRYACLFDGKHQGHLG